MQTIIWYTHTHTHTHWQPTAIRGHSEKKPKMNYKLWLTKQKIEFRNSREKMVLMLDLLKTTREKKLHLFNFVLCIPSNWQLFFGNSMRKTTGIFFSPGTVTAARVFPVSVSLSLFRSWFISTSLYFYRQKLFKCSKANSF